jgi:hypothetical protein
MCVQQILQYDNFGTYRIPKIETSYFIMAKRWDTTPLYDDGTTSKKF